MIHPQHFRFVIKSGMQKERQFLTFSTESNILLSICPGDIVTRDYNDGLTMREGVRKEVDNRGAQESRF